MTRGQIVESETGFEVAHGYRAAFRNGHQRDVLLTWIALQIALWQVCGAGPWQVNA